MKTRKQAPTVLVAFRCPRADSERVERTLKERKKLERARGRDMKPSRTSILVEALRIGLTVMEEGK